MSCQSPARPDAHCHGPERDSNRGRSAETSSDVSPPRAFGHVALRDEPIPTSCAPTGAQPENVMASKNRATLTLSRGLATATLLSLLGFHWTGPSRWVAPSSMGFNRSGPAATSTFEPAPAVDRVLRASRHEARLKMDEDRDETRRPRRILDFFDIKAGQAVADIQAGNGYYTELLSRIVGEEGEVFCVNDAVTQRLYGEQLTQRLEGERLDDSNIIRLDVPLTNMELPDYLDRVLLVRFYHDFGWMEVDRAKFNQAVFDSLKPGGIYGVIDHHAKEGTGIADGGTLHRIEASLVKEEVERAGFVLEAESYVLRDETDGRDFNIFADGQKRRDKTDRFVYLFRKPE